MQDKLFNKLTEGPIADYRSGKSTDLKAAQKQAAAIWASVADPDTGKSHYAGVANNKSSIDPQEVAKALQASSKVIDKGLVNGAQASVVNNQALNSRVANNTSQVESNFNGTINIHAPNNSANSDIASLIGKQFESYSYGSMANTGLT